MAAIFLSIMSLLSLLLVLLVDAIEIKTGISSPLQEYNSLWQKHHDQNAKNGGKESKYRYEQDTGTQFNGINSMSMSNMPPTLEELTLFIEDVMECYGIPGLSIAISKDGENIYSRGFGVKDMMNNLENVTVETVFAQGSTTKAFTALLALRSGIDIYQHTNYTPMHDHMAGERMRVLDMLSHQTGLPRHEMSWIGGNTHFDNYKDVNDLLQYLQNNEDFRTTFQYNNLMWVAVTALVEEITGSVWPDYLRSQILTPLGMNSTFATLEEAYRLLEDPDNILAKPHGFVGGNMMRYYDDVNEHVIDPVGPAGSMYSSPTSMLPWLNHLIDEVKNNENGIDASVAFPPRKSLDGGTFYMAPPTYPISADATSYSLGWVFEHYRGNRAFSHGGSVLGMCAEHAFLPDLGVGVAVYMNIDCGASGALFNALTLIRWMAIDAAAQLTQWMNSDDACQFPCSFDPDHPYCFLNTNQPQAVSAREKKAMELYQSQLANLEHELKSRTTKTMATYFHPGYGEMIITFSANDIPIYFEFYDFAGVMVHDELIDDIYFGLPSWFNIAPECEEPLACVGIFLFRISNEDHSVVECLMEASVDMIQFTLVTTINNSK